MRRSVAAVAAGLWLAFAGAAVAAENAAWTQCTGPDADSGQRVAACTAAIVSGSLSPEKLAIAHYNRGLALARSGQYERAIPDFDEAIRRKPDDFEAFNDRGLTYHYLGEFDRAIQDYDKALSLNADYVDAYYNRGNTNVAKGDLERAIQDYDSAIRLSPDDFEALNNRGLTYITTGDLARALSDLDRAIALRPDFARAFGNRCLARALADETFEAALADCTEALRLVPGVAGVLGTRGFVHFRMRQMEAALVDLDAAIAGDSTLADAFYVRGLVKRATGDIDGGNADIAAATGLYPKIAEAYAQYGVTP